MSTFEPPTVFRVPGFGYGVKSRTNPGAYWLIAPPDGCPCPARVQRCWHQRQLDEYVRAQADDYKRPRAVENPAVFCD